MHTLFRLALVLSAFLAYAAAAAEAVFVRVAEGVTSKDRHVGIVAAPRMFSAPTLEETCARLRSPARLVVVTPEPVRLVRDRWFSYNQLAVLAVDASGRVLPPVPVAVEVEQVTPEVLNLRSDMTADPDGRVLPVRTGGFRFRLRTICAGDSAVVVVRAEVVKP